MRATAIEIVATAIAASARFNPGRNCSGNAVRSHWRRSPSQGADTTTATDAANASAQRPNGTPLRYLNWRRSLLKLLGHEPQHQGPQERHDNEHQSERAHDGRACRQIEDHREVEAEGRDDDAHHPAD